jgi:predicted lipid-binding transport protein (Tim44 family)
MQIQTDILILAGIAALIIGRLFFILGTRNENDTPRPNPFAPREKAQGTDGDEPFLRSATGKTAKDQPADPTGEPERPALRLRTPPPAGSLAAGFAEIAAADPSFDERAFLREAKSTFTAVVEAYASGRLETVADRLAGPLMSQFKHAAELRHAEGHSATTRVRAIRDADIVSARADQDRLIIAVKFVSDQENILRDQAGNVIGGNEGQAEEVTDVWTFLRDATRADAAWIIIETRA